MKSVAELKRLIVKTSGITKQAADNGFANIPFMKIPGARAATLFQIYLWAEARAKTGDSEARQIANDYAHMQYDSEAEGAAVSIAPGIFELLNPSRGEQRLRALKPAPQARRVVSMSHRLTIMQQAILSLKSLLTASLVGRDSGTELSTEDYAVFWHSLRLAQATFDDSQSPRFVIVHQIPGAEKLQVFFKMMTALRRWRDALRHTDQTLEEFRDQLFSLYRTKIFTVADQSIELLCQQFDAYRGILKVSLKPTSAASSLSAAIEKADIAHQPQQIWDQIYQIHSNLAFMLERLAGGRADRVADLVKHCIQDAGADKLLQYLPVVLTEEQRNKLSPLWQRMLATPYADRKASEDTSTMAADIQAYAAMTVLLHKTNIFCQFYYRISYALLDREWLGAFIQFANPSSAKAKRSGEGLILPRITKLNPSVPVENLMAFLHVCLDSGVALEHGLNILSTISAKINAVNACQEESMVPTTASLVRALCQFYHDLPDQKKVGVDGRYQHPLQKVYQFLKEVPADQLWKQRLLTQIGEDIWPFFAAELKKVTSFDLQGKPDTLVMQTVVFDMPSVTAANILFDHSLEGGPAEDLGWMKIAATHCLDTMTQQHCAAGEVLVSRTVHQAGHVELFGRLFDRISGAVGVDQAPLVDQIFLKDCLMAATRSVYFIRAQLHNDSVKQVSPEKQRENRNQCKIYFRHARNLYEKLLDSVEDEKQMREPMGYALSLRQYDLFVMFFHLLYVKKSQALISKVLDPFYTERKAIVRGRAVMLPTPLIPRALCWAKSISVIPEFERKFNSFLRDLGVRYVSENERFKRLVNPGESYALLQSYAGEVCCLHSFLERLPPLFSSFETCIPHLRKLLQGKKKKRSGARVRLTSNAMPPAAAMTTGVGSGGGGSKDSKGVSARLAAKPDRVQQMEQDIERRSTPPDTPGA